MNGQDLREWFRYYACPSVTVKRGGDRRKLHNIGHICRMHLETKYDDLLRLGAVQGLPTMDVYMNDGWSASVWKYDRENGVCRALKTRKEFILQRSVGQVLLPNGSCKTAIRLEEPRPLNHGKCAHHLFGAQLEFSKPLQMTHPGWTLQAHIFDGLHFLPLMRFARARQALLLESGLLATDDFDIGIRRYRGLIWGKKCVLHGCSNAIKWGMSLE